jgi:hypothetical protein
MRRPNTPLAVLVGALLAAPPALAPAYPEYQIHVQQTSGRTVNCAMCHAHPDGPEGGKPGQIGRLDAAGLDALGKARTALEPGTVVHNPILNEFGNNMVFQVGRARLLTLRLEPAKLADSLDPASDTDGDGIPDARELREGTDAVDPNHGNPWLLFKINFQRNGFHLAMAALATVLGLFGLNHLLHGLHLVARRHEIHDHPGEGHQ